MKYCLECDEPLTKSHKNTKYCGSQGERGSCAYKIHNRQTASYKKKSGVYTKPKIGRNPRIYNDEYADRDAFRWLNG